MEVATAHRLLDEIVGQGVVAQRLTCVRQLRGFLDAAEAAMAHEVVEAGGFAEGVLAEASGTGLGAAGRVIERAELLDRVPALADALADGSITGAHVDHVARAVRSLEPTERRVFLDGVEQLVAVAQQAPAERFARTVAAAANEARRESDVDRLTRQVRDSRLCLRQDRIGAHWQLSGRLDAVSGARLRDLLDAAATRIEISDMAPSDPLERYGWIRAYALVHLAEHGSTRDRPVVVADRRGAQVIFDWGADNGVPRSLTERLVAYANPLVIEVRPSGEPAVTGLDRGRTCRHATVEQRRILRGLYPTCAIPGCDVRFPLLDIHHVIEWEGQVGETNLDNLLPVCGHHHTQVHTEHWALTLRADRTLHIRFPDGSERTTGPPRRWAG